MPKTSPYSINYFLSYTAGSFIKTHEIATDSTRVFDFIGATDTTVLTIGTKIRPIATLVGTNYLNFMLAESISYRETRKANAFEDSIIPTLRKLDNDILHIFDEGTENYKSVFVKGRSTIYEGLPIHTQIVNLKRLSALMGLHTELTTLKAAFDIYIGLLEKAISNSLDSKTDLENKSRLMEVSRVGWCTKAYGCSGDLMSYYEAEPERVDTIFDLSIFDTRQTHVDPDAGAELVILPVNGRVVWGGVFDPTKFYQIHYKGFSTLDLGSAPAIDTDPIPNPTTMIEDESKIFSGAEFGDITNRYLIFKSNDTILAGELMIKEVIPQV